MSYFSLFLLQVAAVVAAGDMRSPPSPQTIRRALISLEMAAVGLPSFDQGLPGPDAANLPDSKNDAKLNDAKLAVSDEFPAKLGAATEKPRLSKIVPENAFAAAAPSAAPAPMNGSISSDDAAMNGSISSGDTAMNGFDSRNATGIDDEVVNETAAAKSSDVGSTANVTSPASETSSGNDTTVAPPVHGASTVNGTGDAGGDAVNSTNSATTNSATTNSATTNSATTNSSTTNSATNSTTNSSTTNSTTDSDTTVKYNDTTSHNVTSGTNGTTCNDDDEAAAMDKPEDFDEDKFIAENADDFSGVPIPSVAKTCERGFRPVENDCVPSRFSRDSARVLIRPVCEKDAHCPMNAICDLTEELCSCVNNHGLPLDPSSCEGSSLGEKCDDENVKCKSWDHVCTKGLCDCLPGHHREDDVCVPFLDLDNDCETGVIPCYGDHVGCVDARGKPCPVNATCACRCHIGYEKDAEKKKCVKPSPPAVDEDEDDEDDEVDEVAPTETAATTSTTTTTTTTTITVKGNHASKPKYSALYFIIGTVSSLFISF